MTTISNASAPRERQLVDDVDLLASLADGGRAAFSELYDRHASAVHAFSRTHLPDRQDAEDTTQDVFVTLWEKRRSVVIVGQSLLPWLLVTCRNKVANRRRASMVQQRHRSDSPVDDSTASTDSDPLLLAEQADLAAALERAVDALSETDRAVFQHCLVDGFSYEDAAHRIGVTSGAVRNRLARVRARLRDELHTLKGTS